METKSSMEATENPTRNQVVQMDRMSIRKLITDDAPQWAIIGEFQILP